MDVSTTTRRLQVPSSTSACGGQSTDRDEEVAALVESQMRREGQLATQTVNCRCQQDVLILQGYVPTYYLKQLAQTIAIGIDGVKRVDNQIEVTKSRSMAAFRRW